MKKKLQMGPCISFLVLISLVFICPGTALAVCPSPSIADYTAYPPFIVAGVKPNFLMMIDNSASQYDLAYIDNGTSTRKPYYCYDQTYRNTKLDGTPNTYEGYFEFNKYYEYDFSNKYFYEISNFPASCNRYISNTLCIEGTNLDTIATPKTVTRFASKGNYLNWLTASKSDLQKKILTGGKYDTTNQFLIPESRGCLGWGFIKEALTSDYGEGAGNTSLKIIFRIKGPPDPYNSSAPSSGGQTYIDIFAGADYNQESCRNAVNIITDTGSNQLDWRNAVYNKNPPPDGCLNSIVGSDLSLETKQKIVFQQAVQECWQYWEKEPHTVGTDAVNTVKNQCPDYLSRCSNDNKKPCSKDQDCGSENQCIYVSPGTIKAGDPALLCSDDYAGYCASVTNSAVTWVAREYGSSDACIIAKHNQYCGMMGVPAVVDPTDAPSVSSSFNNLPALLSDLGIEGQMDQPVKTLTVRIRKTSAPSGLIHDFSNLIRFGTLTFNDNGSAFECGQAGSNISCPKVCSVTRTKSCTNYLDCPSGESCIPATPNTDNLDGAKVKHHIGYVENTPDESVGDHSSGLIKEIDDIRAATWTPFAEAFYNTIGYFANRTDKRLNTGDFNENKPPSRYKCQQNHVLLISDGQPTADRRDTVNSLASQYNDGDTEQTSSTETWDTCPKFAGSKNIDDLAWLAKHRDITDFSKQPLAADEDYNRRTITTHVIYTGATSNETEECDPKTLMQRTAANGGGLYYGPGKDYTYEELKKAIYEILLAVAGATSSGTAVSVLATTGEGEGAVYQAYFYPSRKINNNEVKWTGYVQGLFVDAYGNLREDSNANDQLDLTGDYVLKMWYSSGNKTTYLDKFGDNSADENGNCVSKGDGVLNCEDTDSDGRYDTCTKCDSKLDQPIKFEDISPIWEAGSLLFARSEADRKIYTTLDGFSFTGFAETQLAEDSSKGTFHDGNKVKLRPYLRAASDVEAADIINYTRGAVIPGYRSRSFGTTNTWKLGDIIYSSPAVSGKPSENYDFKYADTSYAAFKDQYKNRRNVVYIGSNDGMLHAFNAGLYDMAGHSFSDVSYAPGQELWAFIPRDLLPHLKWLTDTNYTHAYYVDLKPKISDVRIFTPDGTHPGGWGTILIGGMRFGGKDICVTDDFGSGREDKTFRSAYFALDVTDPLNPRLLWTFTDPGLGLTSSYPAIVKTDNNWYVVFGPGPTAYNGSSALPGNAYVLNLNAGSNGVITGWASGADYWKFPTGDSNAFMSDVIAVDVDTNYTHDVVYLGETYWDSSNNNWKGKMFRLVTKGTDPSNWQLSTLYDAGKPITGSASAAKDSKGNLWVYFGTGRFIDTSDKSTTDQQSFLGIKDICRPWISGNYGCNTPVSSTDLLNVTGASVKVGGNTVTVPHTDISNWTDLLDKINTKKGWYLDFSHPGERNYVKPLILGGVVAWATYVPSADICTPEGKSYVYAVYYETGTSYKEYVFVEEKSSRPEYVGSSKYLGEGAPSSLVGMLTKSGTAKGYAQTSTGAIKEFEYAATLKPYGFKGWKGGGIK